MREINLTIEEMKSEIATQDNRATADPIFMVQERERIYGLSNDYAKGTEEMEDGSEVGYIDRWVSVSPFFTGKAADRFIKENNHRHLELRVYVASGYRNYEWQAVLELLLGQGS